MDKVVAVAKHIKQEVTPRKAQGASGRPGRHMVQSSGARKAAAPARARTAHASTAVVAEPAAPDVLSGPVALAVGVLLVVAAALAIALCLRMVFGGSSILAAGSASGFTVTSGTLPV
jgi:hypothetical protein